MGTLPIDFKIGPVLLEKGTDISVLAEQIKSTVDANKKALSLWQADLRICLHQVNGES